jgi:acetyl-CoA C-acetyltransferase
VKLSKSTEYGLTAPGGEYPVNVSGGSLGNGNMLDANGLFRALEIIIQLRGQAGPRQIPNAQMGLAQSWRGIPTNSGSVLILAI